MPRLPLPPAAALLAILLAPLAHADRIADEASRQEALLRRYSTSEAEDRMDSARRNPDAANQALGAGMSNLMGRMYRRAMANQRDRTRLTDAQLRDSYWQAILNGEDVIAREDREIGILFQLLFSKHYEGQWQATQRLVELQLGLRPGNEVLGPGNATPERAAGTLFGVTSGYDKLQGWALNMLGKLYLTGAGVPRDEAEAYRLFRYCAESAPIPDTEDIATIRARCRLNLATMMEQGWSVDASPENARVLREYTVKTYNEAAGTRLSLEKLEQRVQP
jgi:hypothetical protein